MAIRELRDWQTDSLNKAIKWLIDKKQRRFLINAAPGAGKTIAACAIAQKLFDLDKIDRVIVIAPREEVVNQWAKDFKLVTDRVMVKVTGKSGNIDDFGLDVCATWAAIRGLLDAFQAVCKTHRVLVICDEHHHAAVQATWGEGADSAFSDAKFSLLLTGTPVRSDGAQTVWLAYDDHGKIDYIEEGSYTLTYGQAIGLNYCRPVTFHKHEGNFTVDFETEQIQVSGHGPVDLPKQLARVPGLKSAVDFYRLACIRQFELDGKTPLPTGYQATMLNEAGNKLTERRYRMPNAGGLVIAPTIDMADYMANLLEELEGDKPILVHSQKPGSDQLIGAFRNTNDKRWLVSVGMVSEGVDIQRLRVLVYLPNALTEQAFRQAIGRVVRSLGPEDDTHAYVVMPAYHVLEEYASRVENEMPDWAKEAPFPTTKICPGCGGESDLSASSCKECGYEFPPPVGRFPEFKNCPSCDFLNPVSAESCTHCGASFYIVTLDEALRDGAIVRGMDLSEEEVQESEAMAGPLRRAILRSGDENLLRVIRQIPDEGQIRLASLIEGIQAEIKKKRE